MKTFTCSKQLSDNKNMSYSIKIDKEDKINYVTIFNPSKSKSICVIDGIELKCKNNNNKLHIIMGEDREDKNFALSKIEMGSLNICYHDTEKCEEKIEINYIDIPKDEKIDALMENCVIMLPQGSLTLSFEKYVDELEVNLKITEEPLY